MIRQLALSLWLCASYASFAHGQTRGQAITPQVSFGESSPNVSTVSGDVTIIYVGCFITDYGPIPAFTSTDGVGPNSSMPASVGISGLIFAGSSPAPLLAADASDTSGQFLPSVAGAPLDLSGPNSLIPASVGVPGLITSGSSPATPLWMASSSGMVGQFVGSAGDAPGGLVGINPLTGTFDVPGLITSGSSPTTPLWMASSSGMVGQFPDAILGTSTGEARLNSSSDSYSFSSTGGADIGSLSREISALTENGQIIIAWELVYRSAETL